MKDHHCGKYPKFPPFDGPAECDFHSHGWSAKTWPPQDHAQYYPRGPLMMKWNYNYGRFADAVYPGYPKDKENIMKNPENLESGILGFLSALWIYMTPRSPMPSMHEVSTGFFKPNQHDELSQIFPAFGATTNIFNGNKECNVEFGTESDAAYHRAQIYLDLLTFFNLHPEYHLGCSKMGPFPEEGFSAHAQYFTKGVKPNSCDLVRFPTAYSLYNMNDYKRCVCESWMIEEENCVFGTKDDQPRPDTKPADDEPLDVQDQDKDTKDQDSDDQQKDTDADQSQSKKASKQAGADDDEKTTDDDKDDEEKSGDAEQSKAQTDSQQGHHHESHYTEHGHYVEHPDEGPEAQKLKFMDGKDAPMSAFSTFSEGMAAVAVAVTVLAF